MTSYLNMASTTLLLLASISPTIAFSSVNTSFLTFRQVLVSLAVLSLLAIFLSISVSWLSLPSVGVGLLAAGIFIILSERLVSEVFQKRIHKVFFVLSIVVFALGTSVFFGLKPMIVALCVYLTFSCFDWLKNRKKRKTRIFANGRVNDQKQELIIKNKKNIYFLLLESMHPHDVLKEVYGSGDFNLESYLSGRNFHIYKNIYANYPKTNSSLYNVLSMKNEAKPNIINSCAALSILKENGYIISAFDVSQFVFGDYSTYLDEDNFKTSNYERFVHTQFLPIISQSKIIRSLLRIKDPFLSTPVFNKVFDKLCSFTKSYAGKPKFCMMRFGAEHIPVDIVHRKIDYGQWIAAYPWIYKRAVGEIKAVVEHIQANDDDPLIVLLGDHGTHVYIDTYNKYGKKTHFAETNGITPQLYAKCQFSVLAAIRWPDGAQPPEGVFSHANVFRRIFSALGAEGELLDKEAENTSCFKFENATMCMVRDGAPLEQWEQLDCRTVEDDASDESEHSVNLAHQRFIVASSFVEEKKFVEAVSFLMKTAQSPLGNEKNVSLLGKLLIMLGRASHAEPLMEKMRSLYPRGSMYHVNYTLLLIKALLVQGKISQAGSLFKAVKEHPTLRAEYSEIRFHLHVLQKNYRVLEKCYVALIKKGTLTNAQALDYIRLLRHQNNTKKIEELCGGPNNRFHPNATAIMGLLSLERREWSEAVRHLTKQTRHSSRMPLDFIQLAGALEMQGRKREAFETLLKASGSYKGSDILEIEMGLHIIRNKYHRTKFASVCTKADEYIALLRRTVASAAFFDAQWYCEKYGSLLNGLQPLEHFLLFGTTLALCPNSRFDTGDFTIHYTHSARAGASPVLLCLFSPAYEWTQPSIDFFPTDYITKNAGASNWQQHPIVHQLKNKTNRYNEKVA